MVKKSTLFNCKKTIFTHYFEYANVNKIIN